MQDDFNLRQPPKNHICKGNMYLSKYKTNAQNKMSPKKKHFTINFIHLIYKACQILSTFTSQCHCLHLYSQCLNLLAPEFDI
jgi:hypothetical protein